MVYVTRVQHLQWPLVVSALLFGAMLLWRVRPRFGGPRAGRAGESEVREAEARVAAAKTDAERALALAALGELHARQFGRSGQARTTFLQAMKLDPASVDIVERASLALLHRPRTLEHLLWRRLASTPARDARAATALALQKLAALYAGPLRNRMRARALEQMASAM